MSAILSRTLDTEKKTKVQNITNEIAVSSDMLSVTPESLKKFLSTGRTDTAISKFTDFMSDKKTQDLFFGNIATSTAMAEERKAAE